MTRRRSKRLFVAFLAALIVFVCLNLSQKSVNNHKLHPVNEHVIYKTVAHHETRPIKDHENISYDFETGNNGLTFEVYTKLSTFKLPESIAESQPQSQKIKFSSQYEEIEGYDLVYNSIYSQTNLIVNNEAVNSFPVLAAITELSEFLVDNFDGQRVSRVELDDMFSILFANFAFIIDLDLLSQVKFAQKLVDVNEELPYDSGIPGLVYEFKKLEEYHLADNKLFISFGIDSVEVEALNQVKKQL